MRRSGDVGAGRLIEQLSAGLGAVLSLGFILLLCVPGMPGFMAGPSWAALAGWTLLGAAFYLVRIREIAVIPAQEIDGLVLGEPVGGWVNNTPRGRPILTPPLNVDTPVGATTIPPIGNRRRTHAAGKQGRHHLRRSPGNGRAEARLFAAEGAKVVIGDVLDDVGRQTEAEINETAASPLDMKDGCYRNRPEPAAGLLTVPPYLAVQYDWQGNANIFRSFDLDRMNDRSLQRRRH